MFNSGQQWDQPNGWAPLQWIAVTGLRNYGFPDIAHQVATRRVGGNIAFYRSPDGNEGGGGEYHDPDRFCWNKRSFAGTRTRLPGGLALLQLVILR